MRVKWKGRSETTLETRSNSSAVAAVAVVAANLSALSHERENKKKLAVGTQNNLRPILMQLGLQSVEKVPFSTFA